MTLSGSGTLTNQANVTSKGTTINADLDNLGGTLHVSGGPASTINGLLITDANSLIRLEAVAGNPGAAAVLTVANGFTNNGLIELTQNGDVWSTPAVLNVGGTLINAPQPRFGPIAVAIPRMS